MDFAHSVDNHRHLSGEVDSVPDRALSPQQPGPLYSSTSGNFSHDFSAAGDVAMYDNIANWPVADLEGLWDLDFAEPPIFASSDAQDNATLQSPSGGLFQSHTVEGGQYTSQSDYLASSTPNHCGAGPVSMFADNTSKPHRRTHQFLPRGRSRYTLQGSGKATKAVLNPSDIKTPSFRRRSSSRSSQPLRMWQDSPPEEETASLSAVKKAMMAGPSSSLYQDADLQDVGEQGRTFQRSGVHHGSHQLRSVSSFGESHQ